MNANLHVAHGSSSMRRMFVVPRVILLAILAGCSATPPEPRAGLALAEEAIAGGRPAEAIDVLAEYTEDTFRDPEADFTEAELERFKALQAKALLDAGYWWRAYRVVREFPEEHRFSPYYPDVERIVFTAGSNLIRSDWKFFFFADDADDGRVVLEHFLENYPRSRHKGDALQLLGEKSFVEGDWRMAISRYTELRIEHPDSEWTTLALYRIAMARYRALSGPLYDLDEMVMTRNELRDFIANSPENVAFVADAREALAVVQQWLGERHVWLADFYRQIDNPLGERHHLRIAAEEFGETVAGAAARARLGRETPGAAEGR